MKDIIRIDPDIDRRKDRDQDHRINQSLYNIFFHSVKRLFQRFLNALAYNLLKYGKKRV